MNTRLINIAVITAGLAAVPLMAAAADSPAAMDSCVKAFMTSLSDTMARKPKLRETHVVDDHVGVASNEWTLTARDAQDKHPIARVTCTVNSSGQVVDLHDERM
jgi:hypothetical protein